MSLCTTCTPKITVQVPGNCSKCNAVTTHFAYRLCNSCSTQLQECEWCQVPLAGGPSTSTTPVGATPYYITVRTPDAGKIFKNLNIGEEIHVVLDEDQYAWIEWDVNTYTWGRFRLKNRGPFVPDPQNPQYGTRTFEFEVIGSGQGDIQFHEVHRTWSWGWRSGSSGGGVVAGGKTWKADFQVK